MIQQGGHIASGAETFKPLVHSSNQGRYFFSNLEYITKHISLVLLQQGDTASEREVPKLWLQQLVQYKVAYRLYLVMIVLVFNYSYNYYYIHTFSQFQMRILLLEVVLLPGREWNQTRSWRQLKYDECGRSYKRKSHELTWTTNSSVWRTNSLVNSVGIGVARIQIQTKNLYSNE